MRYGRRRRTLLLSIKAISETILETQEEAKRGDGHDMRTTKGEIRMTKHEKKNEERNPDV